MYTESTRAARLSKSCSKCGEPKPLKSFGKCKTTVDKLRPECKACQALFAADYYKQNAEKMKRAARESRLKRRYGVDLETYDQMLEAQDGHCALCPKTDDNGASLAVDHSHKTGKVRGLLCRACNGTLGYLEREDDFITRAVEYIRTR